MWMFKGLALGALGSWIFGFILARAGSSPNGTLAVHYVSVQSVGFYWSWPLFLGLTVLTGGIAKMME